MLARISSGAAGIVAYLETGRKQGREFDRDLIDERFVLEGNIETLDAVIDSIQTSQPGAARYLHITLGFAERFSAADTPGPGEVTLETMTQVTQAYRELLMAAYVEDEYVWYAEAHVPKVSHDIHATTGEALERLPHVHIVVPMRNLVSGRYMNPMGYGLFNIKYQQAIQETINKRFGLRSPIEARRQEVPRDPLMRHRTVPEIVTVRQLKEHLAQQVATGEIETFDQLVKLAEAYGEVRVRRGKADDYINVKPAWAKKGINLKDFCRQTFGDGHTVLRAKEIAEAALPDFEELLQEWRTQACFEARFVNSGNRKKYMALDLAGKMAWLDDSLRIALEKLDAERKMSPEVAVGHRDQSQLEPVDRAVDKSHAARWATENPFSEVSLEPPVNELNEKQMAKLLERVGVFVPMSRLQLGIPSSAKSGDEELGESDLVEAGTTDMAPKRLNFMDSLLKHRLGKGRPTTEQLKTDTSPTLVLEEAVAQFELDRNDYDVTSARDGTPRIRHGDKHYNLGDFFTKHLDVPWEHTRPILEKCYYATLADSLPPPDRKLWTNFTQWRSDQFAKASQAKAEARETASRKILEARTKFKRVKLHAHQLKPVERRTLLAKARAEQLVAAEDARHKAWKLREENPVPSRNAMYRTFLTELANRGQLNALAELRRLARPEPEMGQTITGKKTRLAYAQPHYRVDHTGKVTYFQQGKAVVTDSVKGVNVVAATEFSYTLALKVAVARYGTHLTLNGDPEFVRGMVAAGRRSGLQLNVRDGANQSVTIVKARDEIQR